MGLVFCAAINARTLGSIILSDVTNETGIQFKHTDGSSARRYIMETVCAGVALFDYDNDGAVDIYFLNGAPLKGAQRSDKPGNRLYRNNGDWTFSDMTEEAGVGDTGFGLGVAAGDYNNDGHVDMYLNNFGANVLYRNNGNGTFSDVTQVARGANGSQVGAGACFLDMDGDGDLDLYVSNYLAFSYKEHVSLTVAGVPVYANPRNYRPVPDNLYRNNGNGTFTDVTQESGIGSTAGWGMGTVCADYDNDGDTDIITANDVAENFLWQNDGTGRFKEVGMMTGFAYDFHGEGQGSMGVDCGDYDNDGWLDLYVTSYQRQLATLYRNLGDGQFEDVSLATVAGAATYEHVTWGNTIADLDNDGHRDIFVACGHLQDNVRRYDDTGSYLAKNIVLKNTGQGRFVDVSKTSGTGLQVRLSSRGAGFDDLDNDGDIDAVILNSRQPPTLLRNDSPHQGHWLQVSLQGTKTNRNGIGARVKVVVQGSSLVDEVHSGRGYQSHYGIRLHFGLGARTQVDRIEVNWIGGQTDLYQSISLDTELLLVEGESVPRPGR